LNPGRVFSASSSFSRSIRKMVAADGCWPVFFPVGRTSRLAISCQQVRARCGAVGVAYQWVRAARPAGGGVSS
jgi:hypothetical protein